MPGSKEAEKQGDLEVMRLEGGNDVNPGGLAGFDALKLASLMT
jgi:hypothetical protein